VGKYLNTIVAGMFLLYSHSLNVQEQKVKGDFNGNGTTETATFEKYPKGEGNLGKIIFDEELPEITRVKCDSIYVIKKDGKDYLALYDKTNNETWIYRFEGIWHSKKL